MKTREKAEKWEPVPLTRQKDLSDLARQGKKPHRRKSNHQPKKPNKRKGKLRDRLKKTRRYRLYERKRPNRLPLKLNKVKN